jgi:ATP-dependent helicase/nuclease subunit B
MSLRLIYGRAGSGKTRFCLDEMKSRINADPESHLVLLVPEQFTFQAERDLVSVLKTGGILKTEVLSFRRLAHRVFNDVGGITYPHIHPAGKCMLIYRILDRMRGSFRTFGKSFEREGFVSAVSTLITEFKRYNVTPELLKKAGEELGEEHPLREKLAELQLIYEVFEKTLSERYRNSDDDLTLAARKLESSALYDGAEIWIDGFASFTPQEYGIIDRLMRKAKRLSISFCTDDPENVWASGELDVFNSTKAAWSKLKKMAEANGTAVEEPVYLDGEPLPRFIDSPELSHLERNLNAWPYKEYNGKTRDISIFTAADPFSEVESAARDILRLTRDMNLRYRDIAVVMRNLESYDRIIEAIFGEYGIPCFIDRKVGISDHPLVRLILSMMDIFNENWSHEAVFRYLKTGLTGVPREDIDELENYVLACGIRGNRWTSDEDWRMTPELIPSDDAAESQGEMLERINQIRRRVSGPLIEFRNRTKGRNTAAAYCSALYDFLCETGVPGLIEDRVERFRKGGALSLANEYSQVWNTVMEVFDQAAEVMDDETFGLERFSRILAIGFAEYRIGLVPPSLDQVLVGSVERSRSREIKAMFILGANDGIFPSSSAAEGILSDQDRAALSRIGMELAGDTRSRAFDEQYLVYRALTTAEKRLRVSWPTGDREGRTLRPSLVISRLRKLFPEISEKSDILPPDSAEEELELVEGKSPAFRRMIAALRNRADGRGIHAVWEDAWRWFEAHEEWKRSCDVVREAFDYRNPAGRISRDRVAALYGDPALSSVSRIEKYTACPFAFFVQYGLGAKERKIYSLSPPDIGTFMHAVIERFSRIVARREMTWRGFDREWCQETVSKIVDEMLDRMGGSGLAASKRFSTLAARLKRVVGRAVWLIAEHIRRGSFDPVDYEAGFGEGEKYPPIAIELESGEVIRLTGRIDRIDALKTEEGTYLRIIDYKSGLKDFKLSDVYYGLQIQLITYLDAIWGSGAGTEPYSHSAECSAGASSPNLPGGILYFRIDDPMIRVNAETTPEEIEAAIMRRLRMNGLLLADVKLIRGMDNEINGHSMIIPASVNKGDTLGKNTSAATLDQFNMLRKYVKRLLTGLCSEIMKGNADIKPYRRKGETPCRYCSFMPVCQFDPSLKDNSYRMLHDRDDEEIWKLMENEREAP